MECYSVTINAQGTRLASGGLDGNVKIWDTHTIQQFCKISKNSPSDLNQKQGPIGILDEVEEDLLPPKSLRRPLCSVSRHNGVVTSVKFSPDGRFLASGSDDKICLIWEKDEEAANRPKQFGEVEADLEHWTVRKRLVAHDNDIQDICWSPDGLLLVTVGLDRSIIIWNGLTFERIKRYDIHQSMVKGIVFDPANKFFATASDDRTVRIFRYYKKLNEFNNYDFQMEHTVFEPFKKSPLTSYFRRMSWSPDGQHIAVPNATNGPVSSVAIINRGNWATDVSLIGHEAPCEVCAFSPRLFRIGNTEPKRSKDNDGNFSTILATGGQDRSLAVWSTANSRPIVLAQDIVDNSITDMCWSPDGETLYFSCLDGSITCVAFEPNELGKVVSEEMIDAQLHKFGADRESAIFPESVEQLILEEKSRQQDFTNIQLFTPKPESIPVKLVPAIPEKKPEPPAEQPSFKSSSKGNLTPQQLTKLTQSVTITKNGKKRVAPLLVSSSSKPISTLSPTKSTPIKKVHANSKISKSTYFLPRLGLQTSVHGMKQKSGALQPLVNQLTEDQDNDNEDMGIDDTTVTNTNQTTLSEASLKRQKNKLKRSLIELRYPNSFKLISNLPETLFNNQAIINNEINSLLTSLSNSKDIQSEISNMSSMDVDEDLLFSVIIRGVKHTQPVNELVLESGEGQNPDVFTTLEIRNGESWKIDDDEFVYNYKIDFNDPTKVIVSNNNNNTLRKYTMYFPFKIQHALPIVIENKLMYYVLVSFNGTLQIIIADSGKYFCPSFEMGDNIICLKHRNGYLMVLTNSGLIYTWKLLPKLRSIKGVLKGISLAPILNNIEIPLSRHKTTNVTQPAATGTSATTPSINLRKSQTFLLPSVKTIDINPENGTPFLIIDSCHDVYNFSLDLNCWVKVLDSWYYLGLDDFFPHIENKVVSKLVAKTISDFKEDVKRLKVNSYKFENNLKELKDVMTERFQESLSLI